jgi:hypothetical protein
MGDRPLPQRTIFRKTSFVDKEEENGCPAGMFKKDCRKMVVFVQSHENDALNFATHCFYGEQLFVF